LFDISIFLDTPTGDAGETILAEDEIFPVCAPEIAARLTKPEDLLTETWLYDAVWSDDWDRWLAQAAPGLGKKPNGPHFSLYTIALEETKHSAGILMGHATLVDAALKSGDLVAPFGKRVKSGKALTVRIAPHQKASKAVRQVLAMLGV
jgi:LysR family glycine cleavage system transcriptional activator